MITIPLGFTNIDCLRLLPGMGFGGDLDFSM